ncbi:MBL fold metallo-hydrolase, partial [Streptomyces sp. URMC 126]
PEGTEQRLVAAYDDVPDEKSMSEVFDFRTLRPGTFEVGPFTIRTDRVSHPVETYGFRVEHGGKALTYSGDTGVCEALHQL